MSILSQMEGGVGREIRDSNTTLWGSHLTYDIEFLGRLVDMKDEIPQSGIPRPSMYFPQMSERVSHAV